MKRRHTAKFYEDWIYKNHLTKSDMVTYIHRYTGQALERYEVIDFLVEQQYPAYILKHMVSIQ